MISFLSFDFFWDSYLFLVMSEYYSFDGMQCLYRQESSMGVLDDDGTTFLWNVCNNSPITTCHIPEDIVLRTSNSRTLHNTFVKEWPESHPDCHGNVWFVIKPHRGSHGYTWFVIWITPRLLFLCLVCNCNIYSLPRLRLVCDWVTSRLLGQAWFVTESHQGCDGYACFMTESYPGCHGYAFLWLSHIPVSMVLLLLLLFRARLLKLRF